MEFWGNGCYCYVLVSCWCCSCTVLGNHCQKMPEDAWSYGLLFGLSFLSCFPFGGTEYAPYFSYVLTGSGRERCWSYDAASPPLLLWFWGLKPVLSGDWFVALNTIGQWLEATSDGEWIRINWTVLPFNANSFWWTSMSWFVAAMKLKCSMDLQVWDCWEPRPCGLGWVYGTLLCWSFGKPPMLFFTLSVGVPVRVWDSLLTSCSCGCGLCPWVGWLTLLAPAYLLVVSELNRGQQ